MTQSTHFQTCYCDTCKTDRKFHGRECMWCKTVVVNEPEPKYVSHWMTKNNQPRAKQ